MDHIEIIGAKTHNLKNVSLRLPRDKFIVITGLSGSGKSSLAFDTLYAEGQRRYVESLSAYARQFLSMMEKPDVEHIAGLSPAISIEQKSTSHNPRSTVGTVTEIYDYLRLLYARVGQPRCPKHGYSLAAQTVSQMVDTVLKQPLESKWMLLAPVIDDRKGEHLQVLQELKQQGFVRVRVDGEIYAIEDVPILNKKTKHSIEVVVDRFKIRFDLATRLADSFETALRLGQGVAIVAPIDPPYEPTLFSANYACQACGYSVTELQPRLFSFNNPAGACPSCDGLGTKQFFDPSRIIVNPELSLEEGAIRGWDRRNYFYFQMLMSLATHYQFDLNTPYQDLAPEIQDMLLHGSGKEAINFTYRSESGRSFRRKHSFEGILNNMSRRYHETESGQIREELAKYLTTQLCVSCHGSRLCETARNVFVADKGIADITALSVTTALNFFQTLNLSGQQAEIASKIEKEIVARLQFLANVGLDYLTLNRSADTLSGGEAQRIRLASQIGAGLVGVMYVLDEPSIGLHQRDNERLLKTLTDLRDMGNTVIVVEHDEDAIRHADYLVDIGPGAGVHGGEIVAAGQITDLINTPRSVTGQFLSGARAIKVPTKRRKISNEHQLVLTGANGNNLKDVTLTIPLGVFTCVTGVSGSGKSTLINETLYPLVASYFYDGNYDPAPYKSITGVEYLDKVIDIDQSPIGRTPRSNPATYCGIFTLIRELFTQTQEARSRGYKAGRFSFNVKGGRCEACKGDGLIKVEMHFLPDIYVVCDTCEGRRYNRETLEVLYKGKSIYDVLMMTVEEACEFFTAIPGISRRLQTLIDVGLSYIQVGQSATTLSGGEAQRIKLSKELSRRDTGKTLYVLDEPTTGLHFHDIAQLLSVLHCFVDRGNTVVVIEHNLDVIKTADWIVDLGPEGGAGGGQIIATGAPETLVKSPHSHTARFLAPLLKR